MKISLIIPFLIIGLLSGQEPLNRFKKTLPKSERLETAIRSLTHVEVSRMTFQSWQEEHPGKTISRNQVEEWLHDGEAILINQAMMTGLVNFRDKFEHRQQVTKSVIYPDSFLAPKYENEGFLPGSLVSRDTGVSWNMLSELSPEKERTDRLEASFSVYLGKKFTEPGEQDGNQSGDVFKPIFRTSRLDEKLTLPNRDPAKPIKIDLSHSDKVLLVFSNVQENRLPAISKNQAWSDRPLTISASYIKVSHLDWMAFSQECEMDDLIVNSAAWASDLVSKKKATLLYSPSVLLNLRQVGTTQNIDEVIYPTEYFRPDFPEPLSRTNVPIPAAFDTRNIGLALELEPEAHSSGYLTVRYASSLCSYHGKEVSHRYLDGQNRVPDMWMPRFSWITQKGIVALTPGEDTLVGVSSPIDDQGDPDPSNRLLFFLKAE